MSIPQFVDGITELDAVTMNRLVHAANGSADYPIALPGIAGALAERNEQFGDINVVDEGADPTGVNDSTDAILMAQEKGNPYFPQLPNGGRAYYRHSDWLPMLSNRRWHGDGINSVLYNDKTNANAQKRACILPGLMHPALFDDLDSYALDAIATGDYAVDCTTSGHAANFDEDELIIVGSQTAYLDVPFHAQLNKITGISSGTITLQDAIAVAIDDPVIWKFGAIDASAGMATYAVENVIVENLAFMGRSGLATKSAVYNGTFRNIYNLDVHHFQSGNMFTHCLFDNWYGAWSGRYIELANNSYDVTMRHFRGQFRPPTGLQAGESMILPIHIGEQPYKILLDDIMCHVDSRFTTAIELAQLKGSEITVRDPDWEHGGSAGSYVWGAYDSRYEGHPPRNILISGGRMSAPGKIRIGFVGGIVGVGDPITNSQPVGVALRDTVFDGTLTDETIRYRSGRGHICDIQNRTGKGIVVEPTAQFPSMANYRVAS